MKNIEYKCPRCGNVQQFTYRQAAKGVECHHCHLKAHLDEKTEKRKKFIGYLGTFAVSLLMSMLIALFMQNVPTAVIIVLVLLLGVVSASITTPIGDYLTYVIYGYGLEADPVKKK